MKTYISSQTIGQLEKSKGGYFFLIIEADIIKQFQNNRHTHLFCTLVQYLTIQCGLNHLEDGNFFITLSNSNLDFIQNKLGDKIHFELNEDPNPLGVEMPEMLEAIIEQDGHLKAIFESLTLGKKHKIIHQISRIKDIYKQIQKALN